MGPVKTKTPKRHSSGRARSRAPLNFNVRRSLEAMTATVAFLDYSVIDHLHRLASGTYTGKHGAALHSLEAGAATGKYELWMAEITEVEMIIGRENPKIDQGRVPEFVRKDCEKFAIAEKLGVRWLGYPCSKLGDEYSRLGVSFRLAGPDSLIAAALERRLEQIAGVSVGDPRQVVSLVHGFDDADVSFRPAIRWLVTEDARLCAALCGEANAGRLPELVNVHIGSVAEFVAGA